MMTVYSKNVCPFCDQAKALLNSKNIEYKVVNIEEDAEGRNFLVSQGLRSVPQIYEEDTLIGGFDKLKEWVALNEITSQIKL
jgi:glutaredoxin 3